MILNGFKLDEVPQVNEYGYIVVNGGAYAPNGDGTADCMCVGTDDELYQYMTVNPDPKPYPTRPHR
jgi:hypothetical protein